MRLSSAAVEAAIARSQLIHEQQKERGLSGGLLASKGEPFGPQLASQRELTNRKLDGLGSVAKRLNETSLLADALLKPVELAIDKAGAMSDFRRQVDAQSAKPAESLARYTAAISAGIDVISAVAKATNNAEMARAATAYLMFVQAEEFAGRERATLNAAFAAKTFDPESLRRFVGIVSAHDLYMLGFRTFATAEARNIVDETVKGGAVDEVSHMRTKALEPRTLTVAALGSTVAAVVALASSGTMIRRLTRRLGGEPATTAALARAISRGDLTQPIQVAPGDTQSGTGAMRAMQESLREMITSVHATSTERL